MARRCELASSRWSTVGPDRPAARAIAAQVVVAPGDGLRRSERFAVGRDAALSCATGEPATAGRSWRAARTRAAGSSGSRASTIDERRRDAARARAAHSGRRAAAARDRRVLRARPGRVRGRERSAGRRSGVVTRGAVRAAARRCWSWRQPAGEVLVPLAEAICRRVDVAAKRIVIDPPEGLLESERGSDDDADVITIFPAMVEAALAEGVVGRARRVGAGRHSGARPARLHRRSAPHGRRRAVRRRAGDGDEARAAVSGGRGDRGRARARRRRWC